jgi:hypothetical protein
MSDWIIGVWLIAWLAIVVAAAIKTGQKDLRDILRALLIFYIAPLFLALAISDFSFKKLFSGPSTFYDELINRR